MNAATRSAAARERLMVLVLAVFSWPIIAVGVLAGWGFLIWVYDAFSGTVTPPS